MAFLVWKKSLLEGSISVEYLAYIFSGLIGMGGAFFYPPKQSIIPNLVKTEELQSANALNACTSTIAILLGGIASGFFIARMGLLTCLTTISVFYIISAVFTAIINVKETATSKKTSMGGDFKFVINYLKQHKNTLRLITLAILLSLVTATFFHSLNALAIDYYKIGIEGLSKLKGMLGIGMIAGGILVFYLSKKIRPVYVLAIGFFIIVLTTATSKLVTSYSLAWVWLILIGIANAGLVITIDTILQKISPDRIRGKIFGFKSAITTAGFLVATWLVSQVLAVTSAFDIMTFVSLFSLAIALMILFLDRTFSFFVLRSCVVGMFRTFYSVKIQDAASIPKKVK
jgi:MFS family permease